MISIISDQTTGPTRCVNLSCQGCDLVEWKGLLACPTCGKIYDSETEEPAPSKVSYEPAVNRLTDEAMISPLGRPTLLAREKKRTEFDDAFFQGRGIVVLSDNEDLPVSIEQERKQQQAQTQRRRPGTRERDFRPTKSRENIQLHS